MYEELIIRTAKSTPDEFLILALNAKTNAYLSASRDGNKIKMKSLREDIQILSEMLLVKDMKETPDHLVRQYHDFQNFQNLFNPKIG